MSLPGLPLRAGWTLATRAYDLFSPVALHPRVPGILALPAPTPVQTPIPAPPPRSQATRLADPILLLEGETGARVVTAFLVENERGERVSAAIVISSFAGPDGDTASPLVEISPAVLELGAGEQALVQVATVLGPELEADVRYVGRISIPGLSETSVPIAARRRVAAAA